MPETPMAPDETIAFSTVVQSIQDFSGKLMKRNPPVTPLVDGYTTVQTHMIVLREILLPKCIFLLNTATPLL